MVVHAFFIASDRTHGVAVNLQPMFDSMSDDVIIRIMANSKLNDIELIRGYLDEINDKQLNELITYIDLKALTLVSAVSPTDWTEYVRVSRTNIVRRSRTEIPAAVAVADFDHAALLAKNLAEFNRYMLHIGGFTITWWLFGLLLVPQVWLRVMFACCLVLGGPLMLIHAYRYGYNTAAAMHYSIRGKRAMSLKNSDMQELDGKISLE